ncbi:MAG: dual specificity protein phosphatase family protein [Thaumarchaeota archaeon]|nr:dual specificity protein phosphatase family protein [Candidatus Calditenuaceae archaeon]MDW8187577.1 dual specificity protein phosphatase family protein [Nitrososphaerota archaeon]
MNAGDLLRRVRGVFFDRPQNFGWFEDGLAASGRPVNRSQLKYVRSRGVDAVLSLTEEPLPQELLMGSGLEYRHVPMRNHEMPSREELLQALKAIKEFRSKGMKVLVHCAAGKGRTGTVLAAYLMATRGLSVGEAITLVRNVRRGSIEAVQEVGLRSIEGSIRGILMS